MIAYWKLVLLTLSITDLAQDEVIKNRKTLPWVALAVSVVVSLVYAWFTGGASALPALVRGVVVGLVTTGMYKLVKDYVRAMRRG